jgi:hypothetical protein
MQGTRDAILGETLGIGVPGAVLVDLGPET